MPHLNRSHCPAKQKCALLIIFAVLINCFIPSSLLARELFSPETTPLQAQSDSVRMYSLATNDLVYNKADQTIYASVPSSAGATGNSILPINPSTGATGASVFIGSEPNKLALADDGKTLYAALDGAFAIRRFDLLTKTPGQQFALGRDSFFGQFSANDLAVAPGNPNLVAVARRNSGFNGSVAVYDNGVQRTRTDSDSSSLAFSASASKLYGNSNSSSGLKTMTIDGSGVTVIAGTTPFAVGGQIKFDNGIVYSSTGQVINPDSGTLLGTFANTSSTAFVPDSSAGRAFYLTSDNFGSSGTWTLKAFDVNTFLSVGTLTVAGIVGQPTSLIRWGTNGLAFRTTGNQLFIIQTSLIPSADPIPTPTPTPTSTPTPTPTPTPALFVSQVPLATNDLIYNPSDQMLYASVPSSVGANGNSITPINPTTSAVGTSVFVGSEPKKIALSDDGKTMYVNLDGAGAIRKFDTASQTAGLQFSVGVSDYGGLWAVSDMAVAPGNPDLLAVARQYRGLSPSEAGVAIFDNGVQRAKTGPGHINGSDYLAFSTSASTLYGNGGSGLTTLTIDATGVASTTTTNFSGGAIKFDNGLVYSPGGQVINPGTGAILGTYSGLGFGTLMVVDSANGRVFFLVSQNSAMQLRAFDINTFLPIGSVNIQGVIDTPTSLVRWGTNGLAFRTPTKVFIIQTSLVNASDPVPAATPTPSPTPTPTPAYIPTFIKKVNLSVNDIAYNPSDQTIYASVPSSVGANGNSITPINPATGSVGTPVFIGSEPDRLALSDNGQTLYVNLDGANAVRRFDLPSQTPGLQFTTSLTQRPADMKVMPGSPQTLAISGGSGSGVAIYDDGVRRTNISGSAYGISAFEFGASPTTIYGFDGYTSAFTFAKITVDSTGAKTTTATSGFSAGFGGDIKFVNGLLYSAGGRVVDPEALAGIGTFQGSGAIAVDVANGRVFFASGGFGSSVTLRAFDINTFLPLGSVTLPSVTGTPVRLYRWGVNGLAFNTSAGLGAPGSTPQNPVYLVQTALVSTAAPVPTGIQLAAETYFASEGSFSPLTITVTRSGDISSSTSVNYATSNGTAIAGSDYTATSGTLTFAPGEISKTINVPIIDDTLYEGTNETFSLTLSNPTGGAQLIAPSTAVVTISDNDFRPSLSIASTAKFTETNAGTTNATIPVTLSNPTVQTVTVDYATSDGTAKAGSDYVTTSGTLTIAPGTTSGTITVPINGDTLVEPDETFTVRLSNATNVSFISNSQSTVTIANDDAPPDLSVAQSATPTPALVGDNITYTITVTNNSTSTAESVLLTDNLPPATAFVSCAATGGGTCGGSGNTRTVAFQTLAPKTSATITLVAKVNDSTSNGTVIRNTASVSSSLTDPVPANNSAAIDVTVGTSIMQLNAATYTVAEDGGYAIVTVTRSGNTSGAATVNYATSDTAGLNSCGLANGIASSRCDYATVVGTLQFAAGENSKAINIPIVDDSYVEGPETLTITLSNATGGVLGQQGTATLTITDNDAANGANPIPGAAFFVRQQYIDFLGREPDPGGFQAWQNILNNCPPSGKDANGNFCDRIEVSAGFFRSPEFQDRGYFVYRFYSVALGRVPHYSEFMPDLAKVSGFLNDQQLEANKVAFVDEFMSRPEFQMKYGSLTDPTAYVDALLQTCGLPDHPLRGAWISLLSSGQATRAQVLRGLSESVEVYNKFYTESFVVMQYFGYLRRDPDALYTEWIRIMNQNGGDYRGMISGFMNSNEYVLRFGP